MLLTIFAEVKCLFIIELCRKLVWNQMIMMLSRKYPVSKVGFVELESPINKLALQKLGV